MKIKPISLLLFTCFALLSTYGFSQNKSFWKKADEQRTLTSEKEFRNANPDTYTLFELDTQSFEDALSLAPTRKSNKKSNVLISLPSQNGELANFRVFEASVFSDGLKQQFPSIKSYVAQGIDDPGAIARLSVSKIGVHIMITSPRHSTVFVDPYTKDKGFYIQYAREDLIEVPSEFQCLVENTDDVGVDIDDTTVRNADDGKLRTFRLAVGTTGEYSNYHLNAQGIDPSATDAVKKAAVLMAINVTMTRVNGVFERDVAVRMELVPNNTDIIFLNAATDGYTNNNPFALLDENQTICDNIIGNANYDIGHVFSTQGGGVAQLNSPCVTGSKARGVTGINNPIGDFYDIDYVAHEMGHQYGGQHPQNNDCQRSGSSIEPGSASTIMGYAGICAPNVQSHSDDYFNGLSIIQMWNNVSNGNSTCAAQTDTNNDPPVADAGSPHQIPALTPFILKGEATDANSNDVLTYCWEQIDPQPAPMPPSPTSTVGPNFRSLQPQLSQDRYMPAIETVLAGNTQTTWEVLPSVTRTLTFRLTVKDNVLNGASSSSDLTAIFVNDNSGPFVVTSQATAEDWPLGSTQTVTWDVANTTEAPVSAANVDILLSLDGGQTFDVVLATAVENDGTHEISVPNIPNTNQARVMVMGTDNVFYNVNATDFIISGIFSTSDFELADVRLWPNPTAGEMNVAFTAINDKVTIDLYDLRGRKLSRSEYAANNGSNFTAKVDYSSFAQGMYFMKIASGNSSITKQIILK